MWLRATLISRRLSEVPVAAITFASASAVVVCSTATEMNRNVLIELLVKIQRSTSPNNPVPLTTMKQHDVGQNVDEKKGIGSLTTEVLRIHVFQIQRG